MNKIMIGTAATAMLFCGGVSANEVEANIALSSDYVFRGFLKRMKIPLFLAASIMRLTAVFILVLGPPMSILTMIHP
jgi:hypothetical protein